MEIFRKGFDAVLWALSIVFLSFFLGNEVFADQKLFQSTHPRWKAECGSCHLAYPPELLPAASWRTIMSNLRNHFGADASLDAGSSADIGTFLEQNAASGKFARSGALRITDSGWFRHEHGEARLMPRSASRFSDCAGCHTAAEQGDFRGRSLRLSAGSRR